MTSVGEGKRQAGKSLQLVTGVQRSLIRMIRRVTCCHSQCEKRRLFSPTYSQPSATSWLNHRK